jgi:hypothetical protein
VPCGGLDLTLVAPWSKNTERLSQQLSQHAWRPWRAMRARGMDRADFLEGILEATPGIESGFAD